MSNDQYCVNNTQLCQRAAGHDLLTEARCYCAAFNGKLFNHVSITVLLCYCVAFNGKLFNYVSITVLLCGV